MTHLLTFDQAQREIGISKAALMTAIETGDLVQVELESHRGARKKYVTRSSLNAWIGRLNGDPPPKPTEDGPPISMQVSTLGFHLRGLTDKIDQLASRLEGRQERDRRTRLRHTVSSRIGDAFDPHGYYVYLLWGDDLETPLYIGQSRNILGRLGSHLNDNGKRWQIKSVQLIKCNGKPTMDRTEAALIREYKPPMNTVGVR